MYTVSFLKRKPILYTFTFYSTDHVIILVIQYYRRVRQNHNQRQHHSCHYGNQYQHQKGYNSQQPYGRPASCETQYIDYDDDDGQVSMV